MSKLVVRSHRPWALSLIVLIVALGTVAAGYGLFEYGRSRGGFDSASARAEQHRLLRIKEQLLQETAQLREDKAVLERASQVERKAYAEVNRTLRSLQNEILELKEELAFYRGIVSPTDASRGLRLQSFRIEKGAQERGYRYRLVLTQVLQNDTVVQGHVTMRISGLRNGQPVELGLADVVEQGAKELPFRFKYFQNLEGDLVLPADFQPLRVAVDVAPRGRNRTGIEKTFEWPVEEMSHVGKK